MKKTLVIILAMMLVMGLMTSAAGADEINTATDFEVEYLAAPAVAGLLLEAAGVDNRFGNGRDGGNYISLVARHMDPGTDFNGVSKNDELRYACEVAKFLNNLSRPANVICPCAGIFDPVASSATATDNADGTVTLEITVLDRCGNGISGLNPLADFFVRDSVMSGNFYFGTSSIPGSGPTNWSAVDGVYTVTLDRNSFSSRPAGYNDGWYRIWSIYVKGELVEQSLILQTSYYSVGDWKMDLFVGTTLHTRFIVINSHVNGEIDGFFGVGYDPTGNPTGTITGTIDGRSIYMFYDRTDIVTDYTAEFWGTIATDGNSMSGTWTSGTWTMVRQ